MKKYFSILLAAFSLAILAGCGGNSPKAVAEKWHKALLDGDAKTANEYSTEKTAAMNALVAGMLTSKEAKEDKDIKKISEIKFEDGKIDGDNAVVYATHPEAKDEKQEIKLVKKDGKWLVDMQKN